MKRLLLFALPLALMATTGVAAQIMSNPAQWYINNQIYSTRVFNGVVANSMFRKRGGAKRSGATPLPSPGLRRPPNSTAFAFSARSILPSKLAPNDAAAARTLDGFLELYKRTAAKDGFPANDLAYAFEYFVVNNYQLYKDLMEMAPDRDPYARGARDGFERIELISRKRQEQVSPSQERAVYAQFREVLAANPEVAKLSDAQKQEAAELLAILYGVNFAAYTRGIDTGDDELAEQARSLARSGLEKLLGAPSSQITITNNGLEL